MRKSICLISALALVFPVVGASKPSQSLVHHFVETLRSRVAGLEETKYQHRTEIDVAEGRYLCDCSGFLGFFLKRAFPESFASLTGKEAAWRSRPLAVTFFETFVRSGQEEVPGWIRVRDFTKVRPGDILAWRKDELIKGESTGHVLMIISKPERNPDGRFQVRVIDSTSSSHAEDTRGPFGNGVGEGTMWFSVDANFEPTHYFVNERSLAGAAKQIAIGRLTDRPVGGGYGSTLEEDLKKRIELLNSRLSVVGDETEFPGCG